MFYDGQCGVSVIMGTLYQKDDITQLKRAVESILNQTFSQFEFLICDTGSAREASSYLETIGDTRIKLIRHEGCTDLASKLNHCLSKAKAQYIARMDDDDWSCPDRLEKQIEFLEHNNKVSFVGCNVSLVQEGIEVGQRILPEWPTVEDFYLTQPYIHPTLVFRRKVLEAINGYSESRDCVLCEDYDLLLRLYKEGFFGANLQETLFKYTYTSDPKGNRKMCHRINEMKTRFRCFRELGKLPQALPYVVKPVIVGFLPGIIIKAIKQQKG